jgi:hypothetical protein
MTARAQEVRVITLTPEGFSDGTREYMRLEVAARHIGIHPQSLQRLYRNSGDSDDVRRGLKLGRTLFFSLTDLAALGYAQGGGEGGDSNGV